MKASDVACKKESGADARGGRICATTTFRRLLLHALSHPLEHSHAMRDQEPDHGPAIDLRALDAAVRHEQLLAQLKQHGIEYTGP